MMNQTTSFPYAEADGANGKIQVLELPYTGNSVSMVIVLPGEGGLAGLEQDAAAATEPLLAALAPERVEVTLPKWTFSSQFALTAALQALGVKAAFDGELADFSGIDGTRDIAISAVLHKAFVAVDEKGTEAAAATGVIVGATSAPVGQPVQFLADRPFLFFIRHRDTGAVLFAGRVTNPAAA